MAFEDRPFFRRTLELDDLLRQGKRVTPITLGVAMKVLRIYRRQTRVGASIRIPGLPLVPSFGPGSQTAKLRIDEAGIYRGRDGAYGGVLTACLGF